MTQDECRELLALMRETGCTRLRVGEFEAELGPEPVAEQNDELAEQKEPGMCRARSCKAKGGHLKSPYCRVHFTQALKTGDA